jgi:hypothetical protein
MHKHKKIRAIKLRLQGKSYGEIMKIMDLPSKGTLSIWFKDLHLSSLARNKLSANLLLAQKGGFLNLTRNEV